MAQWCSNCCTDHPVQAVCPGDLQPDCPEVESWQVSVETPRGMQGYGVLVAPVGQRFRARILTYPNVLWLVPGGAGTLKFLGRSTAEAERKARDFIRQHCIGRGYVMRDELELLPGQDDFTGPASADRNPLIDDGDSREPRFHRTLPVRFGENMPSLLGRTGNLSESGMFLATDHPLTEGRSVGMVLEMEHIKVPLRGDVIWLRRVPDVGRPPGMGLRLHNPPTDYLRYVQALG